MDEDLPDREADWLIRPTTAYRMMRTIVELYSCATKSSDIGEIADLKGLISERVVTKLIDLLSENDRCLPQTIAGNLGSIYFLTQTYPKLKGENYHWFRAKLDALRKEKNTNIQARKLNNMPKYESIAQIPSKLLDLQQDPDGVFTVGVGWLYHDALLFLINLSYPRRSRNIREAAFHPQRQLNIF